MRSGRKSLGGNVLRDNNRLGLKSPLSISKRRVSFGGTGTSSGAAPLDRSFDLDSSFNTSSSNFDPHSNVNSNADEPKKDRRTMLEEWRAQVRARENGNYSASNASALANMNATPSCDKENYYRSNMDSGDAASNRVEGTLPLAPVAGLTAVERFRIRRKQRLMQQGSGNGGDESSSHSGMPPAIPSDRSSATASTAACSMTEAGASVGAKRPSSICFDDDAPFSSGTGRSTRIGNTPNLNRRKSMLSGGARRRPGTTGRSGRKSIGIAMGGNRFDNMSSSSNVSGIAPPIADKPQEEENSANSLNNGNSSMNISAEIDNADQPGLKSRMVLMEKRILELEKEKMALSMSKAPLEARLRQKEDQWTKDQTKYEQEIYVLKSLSKGETEKSKSVENELEEIQEENRRLRFEIRKQTLGSAENSAGENDNWSRRLQNDREKEEYKDKLKAAEEEIKALRLEKVSIESEINATNIEMSALMRDFDDLQEEYDLLQAREESNGEAEIQLEELTKEHTATLAQLNATSGELASLKSQSKFDMQKKERYWQEEKEKMLFEMSVFKSRAATSVDSADLFVDSEDEAVLRARIEERDRRVEQLETDVLKGEQIRREMHNTIQELRGNIRVFVRKRPFLPGDNGSTTSTLDLHPDGESLVIESKSKTHDFKFDRIFAPSSGQEAVFDEVSEFVQSALDGYNVCLFSYGQTGSGKTHTMQGSGSGAMRGIIPRAVEQVLHQAKAMQKQKWRFTMTASFLEIYNEELKDLLVNMNEGVVTKSSGMATRNQNQNQNKLTIRRERDGKGYVAGLKKIQINTDDAEQGMQRLKNLMVFAARARSVASTKMNDVSSRSHSVFMLHLNGINDEDGTVVEGALNLCDLAGSERLDRSGAGSDAKRLKETQSINKSLSCLGDVFTSLSNGSSHVPFRNSKLTYLLQDCLSGDGKALMFVNLSPTAESSNESLCSLRFAKRVNQVELGKATKHVSYANR
jgi:kinesin family protein C1